MAEFFARLEEEVEGRGDMPIPPLGVGEVV